MGIIYDNKISIAFDVHGCPQRCRHCWLGPQPEGRLTFDDAVSHFQRIREIQQREKLHDAEIEFFGIDYREPHDGPNYRDEYDMVDSINGTRYEVDRDFRLVSLQRLTRDPGYIAWCRDRGIEGAQLKVFGGKDANDFFIGRKDTYEETIQGARWLVDGGIIPRFQVYLNTIGIHSLNTFFSELATYHVLEDMRERGMPVDIHCMTFGSVGRGYENRDYRIEIDDVTLIPEWLVEMTEAKFGKAFELLPEAVLAERILAGDDGPISPENHWLWFFVDRRLDVYTNLTEMHASCRLGNLGEDPWQEILDGYVRDAAPGLETVFSVSKHELVKRHLVPKSRKVYMGAGDLLEYYLAREIRV